MRDHLEAILLKNSIPEPMSGCWLWTAALFWDGYGQFNYTQDGRQIKARAHRVSYEIHNGPFDRALSVLHRCDLPCCVNPDHLFLGTQADNMSDKARKGRAPPVPHIGEAHPNAKFNNAQVLEIRNDPRPIYVIAKAYGVGWSAIKDIKSRRCWGHL